jgi:hypothetical protein
VGAVTAAQERDSLRVAVAAAQPAVLPQQTAEKTEALVKNLKRELRTCQQEVKDYEVYKEVMETAIGRMQVCGCCSVFAVRLWCV